MCYDALNKDSGRSGVSITVGSFIHGANLKLEEVLVRVSKKHSYVQREGGNERNFSLAYLLLINQSIHVRITMQILSSYKVQYTYLTLM